MELDRSGLRPRSSLLRSRPAIASPLSEGQRGPWVPAAARTSIPGRYSHPSSLRRTAVRSAVARSLCIFRIRDRSIWSTSTGNCAGLPGPSIRSPNHRVPRRSPCASSQPAPSSLGSAAARLFFISSCSRARSMPVVGAAVVQPPPLDFDQRQHLGGIFGGHLPGQSKPIAASQSTPEQIYGRNPSRH